MQLGGLLSVFDEYAKQSYIINVRLSVPEIRDFLEQFFTRRTFFINGLMYKGATAKQDDEPLFTFTEPDFTTDDYIEAILPEVIARYTKAYGAPGDQPFSKEWSPKPFVAVTDAQVQQAAIMKERIYEYNQKTLQFRLSKMMHHPIATVWFSSKLGKADIKGKKGEYIISSQEQIEEFIDSKSYYTLNGGKDLALRDIWFEALNEEGSNPKFGWIDIDNPAELPQKEVKEVVSKISKMLEDSGRKHLIMFTGHGYQIWYAPMKGERFNFASDIKNLAETYGGKAGAIVGASSTYRDKAVANAKVWVDTSVYKKNQRLGFFFGMHFKPKRPIEKSSGLVRTPLKRSELSKFDPLVDAHPENVLERFDELKARVDMFCQEVGLGEGFPYADAGFPCYRTPRGENDKKHDMVKRIQSWKKSPKMHELSKRTVGEEALQHDSITIMPKLDGWLGCMAFNNMGNFKVNGINLDKTQRNEGMISSVMTEKQRALMCTKGGIFAWDNYLTHSFADACRSIGITEAIVTGEIVTYNDKGQVANRDAVNSILSRQEGEAIDGIATHDTHTFRKLKFVIHDVLSFDGSDVSKDIPISQRLALLAEMKNDRISVIPHEVLTGDITTNFEAYWRKNVEEANNEGAVIYGGGKRYKVKRKYTLDAAIIGVDTDAKYWQDGKEILSTVVIAVSKNTSRGPAFIAFQRVGNFRMSDEQRADLFQKVLGERRNDGWARNSFTNVIPYEEQENSNIYWVDPKVVVEVEYEGLGNETKLAIMFYRQQLKKAVASGGDIERGYRLAPTGAVASRKLKGPAVIIAERLDKSVLNPHDIREDQADSAGGLQITRKPTKLASEELENPGSVKVTHVRTNPMYGYARGPRWIAAGGMSEPSPTIDFRFGKQKKAGHIAFGDTKRDLEGEFIKPIDKGDPIRGRSGWKPHYEPIWDRARQHSQTGIDFYPELTGMSFSSADAIFDERGPNIPGARKGLTESQTNQYPLRRLLSDEYHQGGEQSIEDAKQFGRAFAKEVQNLAENEEDGRETLAQLLNKDISEEEKQKLIERKMKSKNFTITKSFSEMDRTPVRSNPASNNAKWNQRTRQYRQEYEDWLGRPEPKPSWKASALKRYEAWEIPLLEKGRKFMDAEENFIYTKAEEAIIHGRFPSLEAEVEDHIFAVIVPGEEDGDFES